MEVMGGFIVGFDNDKHDIFKRQFEFIQRSGVVTAMVGLLTALPETRLYHRLMKEGRIETETTGNNTDAVLNFKPKLNREFLVNGYRELMKKLYEPQHVLPENSNLSQTSSPQWPELAALVQRLSGFPEVILVAGHLASRPRRILAVFLEHASATAATVPLRY